MSKIMIKTPDGKIKTWVSKGNNFSNKEWKKIIKEISKLTKKSDIYIKGDFNVQASEEM